MGYNLNNMFKLQSKIYFSQFPCQLKDCFSHHQYVAFMQTLHYIDKYSFQKYLNNAYNRYNFRILWSTLHDIRHAVINQHYKQTIHLFKHSSWQISHFCMFRHGSANLTDYDGKKNINQCNKLVNVSHFTQRISLLKH